MLQAQKLLVGREDALVHESGEDVVTVCLLVCRGLAREDPNLLVLINFMQNLLVYQTAVSPSLGLQMADSRECCVAPAAGVSPLAIVPAPNDMHPPPPSYVDLR